MTIDEYQVQLRELNGRYNKLLMDHLKSVRRYEGVICGLKFDIAKLTGQTVKQEIDPILNPEKEAKRVKGWFEDREDKRLFYNKKGVCYKAIRIPPKKERVPISLFRLDPH